MLMLTRHPGQIITIRPREDVLPGTSVARLFAEGPIEILVTRVWGNQVCLGIQAHPDLLVNRGERVLPTSSE
jgi:sRNA-binding carbon storage regulator CsrA